MKKLIVILVFSFGLFWGLTTQVDAGWTCCACDPSANPACCDYCSDTPTCSANNTMCAPGTRQCSWSYPSSVPCGCTPGGTTCSSCSAACGGGTQTCSNGCTSWSQSCNTQSCCTAANPAAVTLINPADGATVFTNTPNLSWNPTSSWGRNCPTDNLAKGYRVMLRTFNGSCAGDASGYSLAFESGTSTINWTSYPLTYGETYCWFVRTFNGARIADSARRPFTVAAPPVHQSTIVSTNVCGNRISGRVGIAGTDNPITVISQYSHPAGVANIKQASLAILPDSVRNAATISEVSAMAVSSNYFMATTNINHSNLSASTFAVVNSPSAYSSAVSSGNLTPAGSKTTLMNINGTSATNTKIEIVNATTLRVYWQVRFENTYPLSSNNLYTAAYSQSPSGTWISSANSAVADRSLGLNSTWGVNVTPPTLSIGKPSPINTTDFSINWGATGNGVTNVQGYMWTTNAPLSLLRLTPSNATYNITTVEPVNFSTTNIGVNASNLGTHSYRLPALTNPTESINTKLVARDTACNTAIQSSSTMTSDGWMMTARGDTYTQNSQTSVTPSSLNNISSILSSSDSFFSSYTNSIRDNLLNILARASKQEFILEGYDDWNSKPSRTSSYDNWYEYLLNLVTKNNATIAQLGSTSVSNTNTSNIFSATTYTPKHVRYTGNLTLGPNINCNTRSLIFVEGNLTINPPFVITNSPTGEQMGCMFIVKGNIGIESGTPSTYPASIATTKFDRVEAFFITEQDFYTKIDNRGSGASTLYDGLYLKGSVIAKGETYFNRDLRLFINAEYPAELIEYDPRYTQIFQDELKIIKFSIREKDYIRKMTK